MEQWSVKKFWCFTLNTVAVSFLLVLPLGFCYHSGAPTEACASLTPNHSVSGQALNTLPYMINVNAFRDPSNGQLLYTPGFSYNCKHNIVRQQRSSCQFVHELDISAHLSLYSNSFTNCEWNSLTFPWISYPVQIGCWWYNCSRKILSTKYSRWLSITLLPRTTGGIY